MGGASISYRMELTPLDIMLAIFSVVIAVLLIDESIHAPVLNTYLFSTVSNFF